MDTDRWLAVFGDIDWSECPDGDAGHCFCPGHEEYARRAHEYQIKLWAALDAALAREVS